MADEIKDEVVEPEVVDAEVEEIEDPDEKPVGEGTEVKKFTLSIESAKTKDLGHGVVEVIVSTGSVDRHGEKINVDGIITKHYSGVVLYGHDYEGLPIGKTLSLKKKDGELRAKMQFATEEYPFAKTVYDMVRGGYLTDVSIGGIVNKWSEDYMTIEELEMVEFSVVPIGANRDAKVVSKAIGKSVESIKDEYDDAVNKHYVERIKSASAVDIADSIKAIEKLLAVLKGASKELSVDVADPEVVRVKLVTMKQQAAEVDRHAETILKTIKIKLKG